MGATIEDQIHRFLVEKEEQRCRAVEAEYNKHSETLGKKEKRRKVTKPWKRSGEAALCQDIDVLQMVTEYDYDLSDESFQQYCAGRGTLHVARESGSKWWEWVADYERTKSAYLNEPYFRHAIEVNGTRQMYSDQEMEFFWELMILARATMQDCWELYSKEKSQSNPG